MKRLWLLVVLVAVLALVGAGIFYVSTKESPIETPVVVTPTSTPETSIPDAWVPFTNATIGIAGLRPTMTEITQDATSIRILYLGPTQTEGTEIFDGYAVTVLSQSLPVTDDPLRSLAEELAATDAEHGTLTAPVTEVRVGELSGYTYIFEGLGRFQIFVLPQDSDRAMVISTLVADPAESGYATLVQQILSHLQAV